MATLTTTLLRPGALLMRQLRMPVKLALIGLMLLLPLTLMVIEAVREARSDLAFTRSELQGARLVASVTQLTAELQVLRGLTNRVLSSDTAAVAERDSARQRLKAALAESDGQLRG